MTKFPYDQVRKKRIVQSLVIALSYFLVCNFISAFDSELTYSRLRAEFKDKFFFFFGHHFWACESSV